MSTHIDMLKYHNLMNLLTYWPEFRYDAISTRGFQFWNRSALAVNCWVIIHCFEVSFKDQITSTQLKWFVFVQLTDKQWIITQQFTYKSWSISILTHNKRSLQLLPTFRHCTTEFPPIGGLCRIRLHVFVTSFKRNNDVPLSIAMTNVILQQQMTSASAHFPRAFKTVNYCLIYHVFLALTL